MSQTISQNSLTGLVVLKAFMHATRPRTFPLAVASILCGTGLAFSQLAFTSSISSSASTGSNYGINTHNWLLFALTLWVALALQILSNLANDYGDGIKGTDKHRDSNSPKRLTATGQLAPAQFRRLIYIWAFLTFWSGVALISIGFDSLRDFLIFLGFGILAIIAAMAYTMGKRPYGYRAMGEGAVVIFFGWLGVLGSAYLQTQHFTLSHLLPATGCGGLAACVLYVNNMRDIYTDKQANKITLAVMLGDIHMQRGYYLLITLSLLCYAAYGVYFNPYSAIWILAIPLIFKHLSVIQSSKGGMANHKTDTGLKTDTVLIGTQLKTIVMTTLIINILFVSGLAMNYLF